MIPAVAGPVAASRRGVPVDLLLDFESGTPGDMITLTDLAAATRAASPGTWSITRGVPLTHSRITATNVVRRVPLTVDGIRRSGVGTRGFRFNLNETTQDNWDGLTWTPGTSFDEITVTALMKFGAVGDDEADTRIDHLLAYATKWGVVQQFISFGDPPGSAGVLRPHGEASAVSTYGPGIPIDPDVWYSVALKLNTTLQRVQIMVIDAETGEFIGASECASDLAGPVSQVTFQSYLFWFGGETFFDNFALDWTNAAFPLEPVTITAPSTPEAEQTANDEITLTWTSRTTVHRIERNADGAGWVTIESAHETGEWIGSPIEYVDTTVEDGVEYQYRITSVVNEHESSASPSNSVTVDNALSPVATDGFAYGTFVDLHDQANWDKPAASSNILIFNEGIIPSGTNGQSRLAYYSAIAFAANHRVELTIAANGGAAWEMVGAAVRVQSSEFSGYMLAASRTQLFVLARIAGTETSLFASDDGGMDLQVGDRIALEVSGSGSSTRLKVQVDAGSGWADKWTDVDPGSGNYLDGGAAGVCSYSWNNTTFRLDDWKAYDLP